MRNDELERLVNQRTSKLESENKELSSEMEIHKKAEEKLLKKQDHFLKIFSAVPVGLLLLNGATEIVEANQAIYSMVLRDPIDVIGRRAGNGLGCIHSYEDSKGCGFSNSCPACPLRRGIEQIIAESPCVVDAELNLTLMIDDKPQLRCLNVSAEPVEIDGHLYVIVAIDDMTDRKKTEEALRESEKRMSIILESEPECVKIINPDGDLVYMNPAGLDMIDADNLGQVMGQSLLPLIGEKYREAFADNFLNALNGGGGKLEFDVVGLKGRHIWLESNSVPLRLQNEEIAGVLSITRDISDRKLAEDKLKRSLSLVNATLESTVDGILVVDTERKVRRYNNKFAELWRIPESVLATLDDETLLAFVLDQLSEPQIFLEKVEGLYLTDSESFDVVDFKDGRIFEFYSRPQELDGEKIGRVWSFRDVTERKKAEEALEESKRQLEELNATKDKLFSIIGHDMRGPIGGFKQLIDLTISDCDLSDTQSVSEILEVIQQSANTIYELLENLLDWAKSQRDAVMFMPSNLNLHQVIHACISLLSDMASKKDICIHNQTSSKQLVFADQNMLMTILRNLLTNAIKFTHPGNNIYVSVEDTGKAIFIRVKDEGVGMNAENLGNLFKATAGAPRFGTAGEKGTGLGLLLCKEFIEKHGGRIEAESEVGKGSTFCFSLPYARELMN